MCKQSLRVIGIDPGSRCLGWGVVEELSGVLRLQNCGLIRPKGASFSERLGNLYHALLPIIEDEQPHDAAIETVFTYKNVQSAIKLGQARGVAVAVCSACSVFVTDYEPTKIKQSLVGYGRAEKTQVAFMVSRLLGIKNNDLELDTTDALAAAICHLQMRRLSALEAKSMA